MGFPEILPPERAAGQFWVYIAQSADGALYIGQSNDMSERLRKHRLGIGSKFTTDHPSPRLVFCEGPMSQLEAVAREAQLKRWTRAKKEALIKGDLERLLTLSRSREKTNR